MVGEVGLDRAFRVPLDYHATPRVLTSFSIPLEHQLTVLEAQLELAVELGRNVSIHSVKAQQATIDLLMKMKKKHGAEKWNRISVDMHSCGLSPQTWRDLEVGGRIYSFSSAVYEFNSLLSLIAFFNFRLSDFRCLRRNTRTSSSHCLPSSISNTLTTGRSSHRVHLIEFLSSLTTTISTCAQPRHGI